jgi:hypothetical protein
MRKVFIFNTQVGSEYHKFLELTDEQFRLLDYLTGDFVLDDEIDWYEVKDEIRV